ncbi:MAG: glycosyltransferase [candidate division WOR-3 bacterium]|nr:glycosyltransferase [candidate division WOR-3 bacterium]
MFVFATCFEGEKINLKIKNSLELDYPPDKLEIVVVSDAATPETLAELKKAERKGFLRLLENPRRSGKGVALARALAECRSDVFVVTDADTLLEPHHLKELIKPFADQQIGATTGIIHYANVGESGISHSQRLYWRFEMLMRKAENLMGRVVALTGAIYAIRPELFDLSDPRCDADFLAPIQAIGHGKKSLLLDHICALDYAPTSSSSLLKRRIRMITFGLWSMICNIGYLNPFRYPLLSWQLLSHKVLRWLIAIPFLTAFISNFFLLKHPLFLAIFVGQCLFYLAGIVGGLASRLGHNVPLLSSIWYFILSLLGSLVGIFNIIRGKDYTVWQETAQK